MNRQETIVDILREMRGEEWNCDKCGDLCNECPNVVNVINGFATRIEAAWNRERVAIEADALNVGALIEAFRRNDEKKGKAQK